jgi:plasmid stabilization system protein ParE
MRVRYTTTALAEIAEIISYIAQDNEKAASEVSRAIERTVALISGHPNAAPVVYGDKRPRETSWPASIPRLLRCREG